MPTPTVGYTQRHWPDGSSVLVPDSLRRNPKAGGKRIQATPRTRTADMAKLAKAQGWTPAQAAEKTAELIAKKASTQIGSGPALGDVYVPKTKAARTIKPAKGGGRLPVNPFMAERTCDGDYVRDDMARENYTKMSLRERVREAVAAGFMSAEDAKLAGINV